MKSMTINDYQVAIAKLQKQTQTAIRYMSTVWQQGEAFGLIFALKGFITDSEYEALLSAFEKKEKSI